MLCVIGFVMWGCWIVVICEWGLLVWLVFQIGVVVIGVVIDVELLVKCDYGLILCGCFGGFVVVLEDQDCSGQIDRCDEDECVVCYLLFVQWKGVIVIGNVVSGDDFGGGFDFVIYVW